MTEDVKPKAYYKACRARAASRAYQGSFGPQRGADAATSGRGR